MAHDKGQRYGQADYYISEHQPSSTDSETNTRAPHPPRSKATMSIMQHSTETNTKQVFPFLDLPPEIRLNIYDFTFSSLIPSIDSLRAAYPLTRDNIRPFEPRGLLEVCKKTRTEAKPEFLKFLRKQEAEIEECKARAWEEWNRDLESQAAEIEALVGAGDNEEKAKICVEMRWTLEREAIDERLWLAAEVKKVVGILISRSERWKALKSSED